MHRRYEPLKQHNKRMQRVPDSAQAELLMYELERMFAHIFRDDRQSETFTIQQHATAVAVDAPCMVSEPNKG